VARAAWRDARHTQTLPMLKVIALSILHLSVHHGVLAVKDDLAWSGYHR